ncbi:protein tyrosine phosphatase [Acetobacteraceae bacterium]|nr:protein tyrosine phosphatase [Acetobacteraceae bacterium]
MSQKKYLYLFQRFQIWCNSLFKDHAILRIFWKNLSPIIPQKVWRSNHPTPRRFKRLVKQLHLKSIINLRGHRPECGSDRLGREICKNIAIPYENMAFESRNFPQKERILKFYHFWKTLPKPMLIHCKSGADRAGLASALILLFEGYTVQEAQKQLHWRFFHFSRSRTGVLDLFLKLYERTGEKKNISFLDWVQKDYDDVTLREFIQKKRSKS